MTRSIAYAKPLPALVALILLLLASCQPGERAPDAPNDFVLTIIGTNDIHGAVAAHDGRGGLPMLSAYVNAVRELRQKDGGAVLLIDAGDMWQGTLESNLGEGREIVAAFNSMGYAAAAIGNHEFDFGPAGSNDTPVSPADDPRGALKERAAEARFPLLAANLVDDATGRPVDWPNVYPSVMLEVAGVQVGVIGVVTRDAFITTLAANTGGLTVAPLADAIVAEARELRKRGASLVVVTAHAGGRCDEFADAADLSSCEPGAEIFAVAREIPPGLVDHIVAGHVHAGLAHEVNGITITSAYARAAAFGRTDFLIDRGTGAWRERRVFAPHTVCEWIASESKDCVAQDSPNAKAPEFAGSYLVADRAVVAALAPAIQRAAMLKDTELGVTLQSGIRLHAGVRSPLGNMFADGLLAATPGAEIAIHNSHGGLRKDLAAGALTFGSIYEVFPFSNRIVSVELTTMQLRRVFARQLRQERGIQISFAGLRVEAGCDGERLAIEFYRPTGERLVDDERIIVASNDFLITGGDGIFEPVIPPQGFPYHNDGPLMRDIIIDYLQGLQQPLDESRFSDGENPRLQIQQDPPLSCALDGTSLAAG